MKDIWLIVAVGINEKNRNFVCPASTFLRSFNWVQGGLCLCHGIAYLLPPLSKKIRKLLKYSQKSLSMNNPWVRRQGKLMQIKDTCCLMQNAHCPHFPTHLLPLHNYANTHLHLCNDRVFWLFHEAMWKQGRSYLLTLFWHPHNAHSTLQRQSSSFVCGGVSHIAIPNSDLPGKHSFIISLKLFWSPHPYPLHNLMRSKGRRKLESRLNPSQ